MENSTERQFEKRPKIEGFNYDWKYKQFPQTVEYGGVVYDARESNGDSCIYRMTSENRLNSPEPSFIEVDKEGNVIREWN